MQTIALSSPLPPITSLRHSYDLWPTERTERAHFAIQNLPLPFCVSQKRQQLCSDGGTEPGLSIT